MSVFRCPHAGIGRMRCPGWRCDCFVDSHPDDPFGLHPEDFTVGTDRPGGERMTEDTNGLSREQVEALADALCRSDDSEERCDGRELPGGCPDCQDLVRDALAPTVAAMLAEARAEVVRDVMEWAGGRRDIDSLTRIAARHMPAAVREGGTERFGASGGSAVEVHASIGPSDGRTGPQTRVRGRITFERPDPATCGEALGDMRCQLIPGHDGGHEDYRAVAQERRA